MASVVITGTQWGDEGKGKIVDGLTAHADVIVRFQGGNNAGHTLVLEDGRELVLHLVPSGVRHPNKTCIIGNGVVIDPAELFREMDELAALGLLADVEGLKISERAHLILPYHKVIDVARERRLGSARIGTTGRGIGPAYEDKVGRHGVRVSDLLDPRALRERLETLLPEKNLFLERVLDEKPLELAPMLDELGAYAERIAPYVANTSALLGRALAAGKSILFEGAQGSLLDVDHGTYPYVTSSNTVAGAACVGAGIGPTAIDEVAGICKAYTTRVGSGPFPTELTGELGTYLRDTGGEYGATTGRPRRCGWFDAVVVRHAARTNGLTGLILTKLDVLSGLERLSICTGYRLDGEVLLDSVPPVRLLDRIEPIYEEHPGWNDSLTGISRLEDLPAAALAYVRRIEELTGVEVVILSVGRGRDDLITVRNPFERS